MSYLSHVIETFEALKGKYFNVFYVSIVIIKQTKLLKTP